MQIQIHHYVPDGPGYARKITQLLNTGRPKVWTEGHEYRFKSEVLSSERIKVTEVGVPTKFKVPKEEAVGSYKAIMDECLGEGAVPVDHIAALHDLGYLPVRNIRVNA